MIPVEKALEIVLAHTPSLPTEEVLLTDALGRKLGCASAATIKQSALRRPSLDIGAFQYCGRCCDVCEIRSRKCS